MIKEILFTTLCLAIGINSFCQLPDFTLSGKIIGRNDGWIVLQYLDRNSRPVDDTAILKDGAFSFSGFIHEPSFATLIGAVRSQSIDDPNRTDLYLEPGSMTVILRENHFKQLSLTGSRSQNEFELLKKEQQSIRDSLEPALASFTNARIAYANGNTSRAIREKIDQLRSKILPYQEALKRKAYEFILSHPGSYVSAGLMGTTLNIRQIPLDSARLLYNTLTPQVKSSYWGKRIYQDLRSWGNSDTGNPAPLFEQLDINGNLVKLTDYKNRQYVLLDFWASWCIPCRESTPALQSLYARYRQHGFEIISISLDDNERSWKQAVEKDGMSGWKNIRIGNDDAPGSVKTVYHVQPVPDLVLVDRSGQIIARPVSVDSGADSLADLLRKLFP